MFSGNFFGSMWRPARRRWQWAASRRALLMCLMVVALVGTMTGSGLTAPGDNTRVSVDSSGNWGNGFSGLPSISADGRYVAFSSNASNLVAGDDNGFQDIFVRDRDTDDDGDFDEAGAVSTEIVSVDSSGNQGNNHTGEPGDIHSISDDGRYVAFSSLASNLVAGDNNGFRDIFVRDRQAGATERLSVDGSGNEGNDFSFSPSISADGRYVAFHSSATNLVTPDTSGTNHDVFVRDRDSDANDVFDEAGGVSNEIVSVDSSENQGNNSSIRPSISDDGGYVAFESIASNLVAGDTNVQRDVFVRDRQAGGTERVSVDSSGNQGNNSSFSPSISADARYVAFNSLASNLVPDGNSGFRQIFVREPWYDFTAPNTTASATTEPGGGTYSEGTWTNKDVGVGLSATDNPGGSGVKQTAYSAINGGQTIANDTVSGDTASVRMSTEGTTTISFNATDRVGNVETPQKTFTVKVDKTAPTLDTDNNDGSDGVTPDDGARGVSRLTNVRATFSEANNMDPATLITSTVTLTKAGSTTPVPASVSYDEATKTVTLNPFPDNRKQKLARSTRYTVKIEGAKDLAGNPLATATWSFKTKRR